MDIKIFALIPIKYNSQRVPGKNFRLMNGKPLFYYIINTLQKCKYINKIIINIDDERTKFAIKKYFKNIIFYNRPKHLLGGDVATNKLFADMIKSMNLNADYYFQTHTTNPLLKLGTINNAIKEFLNDNDKYDSLYSVKQHQTRLYDKNSKAVNHNPKELLPTQDLEPLFEENSCIYLFSRESLLNCNHRIGNNPLMFKMDDIESQDIDIETDFGITEIIMKSLYLNNDKSVIITGACGGIGYSTATLFKENGWNVIGADIKNNRENIDNIDDLYLFDLASENNIIDFTNKVNKKYENINCIVNNAAYQVCKPLRKLDSNDWNKTMNINVKSAYLLSKYLYDKLMKSHGTIINVSSVHAINTSENISFYAASKGCLSSLTRSMALEYSKDNIRVNAVLPGAVDTGMLRDGLARDNFGNNETIDDKIKKLGKKQCSGRVGQPSEIANLIYFLSDNEKSGYIVGQSIIIDGGATIKLSTE